MRPPKILFAALAVLGAGALSIAAVRPALVFGQEGKEGMDQERPQPTKQHEMLMQGVGEWEGTMTMHAQVPGMSNEPNPATESVEAFGPFWTESHFECDFMGTPYEGKGCFTYDQDKGKYVGTWKDNMSSTLAVMEGEMDEDSQTLTMHWEAPNWQGKVVPHRSETTWKENSYEYHMYVGEGDSAQHLMTIEMTRKGSN